MLDKIKKIYKRFLIIAGLGFYIYVLILEKYKILEEVREARILLIIGLIVSALLGINLILDFDKSHKIVSTFVILVFILIFFNYLKEGIKALNKTYIDEFSEMLNLNLANRELNLIVIISFIREPLIKISDYIRSAYDEYDDKNIIS